MRRFAPSRAMSADASGPIADLNITPLIDVMLVLLVVFLLSLPKLTHEVPLDLPQPNPDPAKPLALHRLELTRAGALRLDGVAVDEAGLTARLGPIATDPQSSLVMRTDPEARYERFDQTLAAVKRAGITRLGFEGSSSLK